MNHPLKPLPPKKPTAPPPPSSLIPHPSSFPGTVRLIPTGKLIRITPGLAIQPAPLAAVPAFGVVEWHRRADGTFDAKLVTQDEWVALSDDMATKLGLAIGRDTIIKLGRAGFIRLRRPTPFIIELNVRSLIEHCEAVEEEDFWTDERIEQYREAL